MSKELTGSQQNALATQYGLKSYLSAIFTFTDNSTLKVCERVLTGYEQKIVSVSNLEISSKVGKIGVAGSVTLTLDDSDGLLISSLRMTDWYQASVVVQQHLSGSTSFILFKGKISEPVEWSSNPRTVVVTIDSLVETDEIGFTLEQGDLTYLDPAAIDRMWPLCFGSCIHVPAVRITNKIHGTNLTHYQLQTYEEIQELWEREHGYQAMLRKVEVANGSPIDSREYGQLVQQATEMYVTNLKTQLEERLASNNRPAALGFVQAAGAAAGLYQQYNFQQNLYNRITQDIEKLTKRNEILDTKINNAEDPQEYIIEREANDTKIQQLVEQLNTSVIPAINPTAPGSLVSQLRAVYSQAASYQQELMQFTLTEFRVKNHEAFPSGPIEVILKGARFAGEFVDNVFQVSEPLLSTDSDPIDITITSGENEFSIDSADVNLTAKFCLIEGEETDLYKTIVYVENQEGATCHFTPVQNVPTSLSPDSSVTFDSPFAGATNKTIVETCPLLPARWLVIDDLNYGEDEDLGNVVDVNNVSSYVAPDSRYVLATSGVNVSWGIQPGDEVVLATDDFEELYVANEVASIGVAGVYAERDQEITILPERYYAAHQSYDILGKQSTIIKLHRPLSEYNEGWGNSIYVSLKSSLPSNVADVLKYLIENYTPYEIDVPSYISLKTACVKYPVNFAILDSRNAVSLIEDIAWQARCGLLLHNDTVYFKYLPTQPSPSLSLTTDDIIAGSARIVFEDAGDIVTKFNALWRRSYTDEEQVLTLRNNIAKYGKKERDYQFYIYNTESLVLKSAKFWAYRQSRVWTQVSFRTLLRTLELNLYDLVNLTYAYFDSTPCILESWNYNPSDAELHLSLWVPVEVGTAVVDSKVWPA